MWELLGTARDLFRGEGRLIHLPEGRTAVFVGDTHGDREATEKFLDRFFHEDSVLVFLGDYVDRGPDSQGNLRLLLKAKVEHPDRIFLLMGNHEAWAVAPFTPADFWRELSPREERALAETLAFLPLAAFHPAGVLALHGALPDVEKVEDIAEIRLGSADWRKITWGDWLEGPGYALGEGFGRPLFGQDYFQQVATRLGLKVLVRAHQPNDPTYLYEGRCLTLFTTHAYGGTPRRVALLPPGKGVETGRDLEILEI